MYFAAINSVPVNYIHISISLHDNYNTKIIYCFT